MGLNVGQMLEIARSLPLDWSMDHREVYFDFRLRRWMRLLEVPTLDECMEDYLRHAPSEEEAMAWMEGKIRDFFQRHGRDWSPVKAQAKT